MKKPVVVDNSLQKRAVAANDKSGPQAKKLKNEVPVGKKNGVKGKPVDDEDEDDDDEDDDDDDDDDLDGVRILLRSQ